MTKKIETSWDHGSEAEYLPWVLLLEWRVRQKEGASTVVIACLSMTVTLDAPLRAEPFLSGRGLHLVSFQESVKT